MLKKNLVQQSSKVDHLSSLSACSWTSYVVLVFPGIRGQDVSLYKFIADVSLYKSIAETQQFRPTDT